MCRRRRMIGSLKKADVIFSAGFFCKAIKLIIGLQTTFKNHSELYVISQNNHTWHT